MTISAGVMNANLILFIVRTPIAFICYGFRTINGADMKLNGYLAKSIAVAALGGLLFGFDTAVISGPTNALAQVYQLSPTLLGVTVASALWRTILGAMLAGLPGDGHSRTVRLP